MKTHIRNCVAHLGVTREEVRRSYLLYLLAVVFICALSYHSDQIDTIWGAVLTGSFAYFLNAFRNLHLEVQLRAAIETTTHGQVSIAVIDPGQRNIRSRDDLVFVVRNRTTVPITIREVRLLFEPPTPTPFRPLRLKYYGQTYHVFDNDPEEREGNYLPTRVGHNDDNKGTYDHAARPEPGDFHDLSPSCGACYGLQADLIRNLLPNSRLLECTLVVDYPTIFGGRRVVAVAMKESGRTFIQHLIESVPAALERRDREQQEMTE